MIDNARFLILPWIRIPNLGSHTLSVVCRQRPADWTARYDRHKQYGKPRKAIWLRPLARYWQRTVNRQAAR